MSESIAYLLFTAETAIFLEQSGERRIAVDDMGGAGLFSSRSQ
jgi:hypothetical protein